MAIKFLTRGAGSAQAARRFEQEARAVSSLNHPHILTLHDVGEHEEVPYLVTEFVPGGKLREWRASGHRQWRQLVAMLVGVADGLAAAHAAGILHRDPRRFDS